MLPFGRGHCECAAPTVTPRLSSLPDSGVMLLALADRRRAVADPQRRGERDRPGARMSVGLDADSRKKRPRTGGLEGR